MTDVIMYSLTGERADRSYTLQELEDIKAAQPTANELIQQQIYILRATITDDIRDRAMLGDTADLKAIYDQINELKSQLT